MLCHYAACSVLLVDMLNVVMLSVVMLSVVMLYVMAPMELHLPLPQILDLVGSAFRGVVRGPLG